MGAASGGASDASVVPPSVVTGGVVDLQPGVAGPVMVRVVDAAGRTVLTRPSVAGHPAARVGLDVSGLSAGVYLVRLEARGFSAVRKLVVPRPASGEGRFDR
jgi:hypothetical protein